MIPRRGSKCGTATPRNYRTSCIRELIKDTSEWHLSDLYGETAFTLSSFPSAFPEVDGAKTKEVNEVHWRMEHFPSEFPSSPIPAVNPHMGVLCFALAEVHLYIIPSTDVTANAQG